MEHHNISSNELNGRSYSKQSLMGNWYEERWAPNQPSTTNPDNKHSREPENSISFSFQGNLLPMARISRREPWITEGLIPNDDYNEKKSLYKTTYDKKNLEYFEGMQNKKSIIKQNGEKVVFPENNPYQVQVRDTKKYNMLNLQNMTEVLNNHRAVHEYKSNFGSTLSKHDEDHTRLYTMTTYHEFFDNPSSSMAKDIVKQTELKEKHCGGINERNPSQRGLKMNSALVGEQFKNNPLDPKDNTAVQRAWLPHKDAALQVVDKNLDTNLMKNTHAGILPKNPMQTYKMNTNQIGSSDIATSLPIGDGEYSLKRKYTNPGEYRHIRTDITLPGNKPFSKK